VGSHAKVLVSYALKATIFRAHTPANPAIRAWSCQVHIRWTYLLLFCDMLLFDCVYHLLKRVPYELEVFDSGKFSLFDPCIDREKSGLVNFLRLDQGIHPSFLPRLQRLDHLSLVKEVFFVF